ncbi:MAG: hypothetical protein H7A32_04745 [Deltaproteobacteria bacterium]|nr:hypothetical protein [Deltaproteobacteria bacterium]
MKIEKSNNLNEKIAKKAEELLIYFKKITRDNGEEIYTLQAGAPQELKDLVYAAHGDFLPDDFRYETIHSALCAFADCHFDEELDEIKVEADIYNHELLKWLSSNLNRIGYCDDAIVEFGLQSNDLMTLITYGQRMEIDEIVASVRESLIELCEE